jgi:hypothetical protein
MSASSTSNQSSPFLELGYERKHDQTAKRTENASSLSYCLDCMPANRKMQLQVASSILELD